jgi:hypothetical protein
MEDDSTCFTDYCIVCDKAIAVEIPTEKTEPTAPIKVVAKKPATGTIRVSLARTFVLASLPERLG